MNKLILVDTSWLLNRSYYAFKDLKDYHNRPIGALFGATNFMKTILKLNIPTVFCLDSKSEFRKEINPEYKANRNSINAWQLHDDLKELTKGLSNVYFADSEGLEADDVIFSLAYQLHEKFDIVVYSSDKDLLQTLQFNNVSFSRKITLSEFEQITEQDEYYQSNFPVTSDRLAIYRAFKGDPSDNLSSIVPRLPDKLAVAFTNIIKERSNPYKKEEIFQIIRSYSWTDSQKVWIDKFEQNYDKFITNYRIMSLNTHDVNTYQLVGTIQDTINHAFSLGLYQYTKFLQNIQGGLI